MADGRMPVFPVLDVGHTVDPEGTALPTVVIDATGAPEVADLARVHAVEGIGDVRTEAIRADDLIVFGIRMTVPVRATFAITLDVERHRGFLQDVVERGTLVIAHTDPRQAAVEQPSWLAVDIDGAALEARLAPS